MSPTIRVDDEVYERLQNEGRAFVDTPNTVLRRLLGLDRSGGGSTQNAAKGSQQGKLGMLLLEGALVPGERLVWERRQNGQVFTAQVTDDARLLTADGTPFDTPSGIARHYAGYEVNGWRVWRRAKDDKTLDDLWNHHFGG